MQGKPDPDPPVRAWAEAVTIPSYGVGAPDRNPMFLDQRVYQGSSGAVYPLAVIDRVEDSRTDREYLGLFLENEFLKVMVLPELGGRVQLALDKTRGEPFVYHNRVIKPALVGLAGPWISGGIEFNWPQHHRPSTFQPLDWDIEEHADGSRTVWCSETDRMQRTKGMHGLRLRPGWAVLEVDVRLYNRTPLPQSFLWWANPAVRGGDGHQSLFPPDVRAVLDHGKRAVSDFPVATGRYYGVDYAPGTDISRYRNIPVPTSYMAFRSDFDFVGSYDHLRGAGLLHVADHRFAPGKKQWTWGHGDFGRAWDRHLTDQDGPYVELMCGAYTDNQPDFTWLAPFEEKRFTQHFFPFQGVGQVRNASAEAAVGLELEDGRLTLRAYLTRPRRGARLVLRRRGGAWKDWRFDGQPSACFEARLAAEGAAEDELEIELRDAAGGLLVRWDPGRVREHGVPAPAEAVGLPAALESAEALWLAGLHLELYRHATRSPEPYYREGLRRDPGDARCNEALGLLLCRRGCFAEAEACLRRAVERLSRHEPNPAHGGAHYGLGVALEAQDRFEEAEDAYAKAAWCAAQRGPAHFALARLACRDARHHEALAQLRLALEFQAGNHRARHLEGCLLGLVGRDREASAVFEDCLRRDPFQHGAAFELFLRDPARRTTLDHRLGADDRNALELALDYRDAGLEERAVQVLEHELARHAAGDTPLVRYHLADLLRRRGRDQEAARHAAAAAPTAPEQRFPNRVESIEVLERALAADSGDGLAPFLLGNLCYAKGQRQRAIACWQRAVERDPGNATAWRNLGLAAVNVERDPARGWDHYRRAFDLDPTDARVLFELDQLARRLGHDPAQRLARLEDHPAALALRDDLALERATLLNLLGRHGDALAVILGRRFHPWEGGEGKVPAQYVHALAELARRALAAGDAEAALGLLARAAEWPESLGEGRLPGHRENWVDYLRGLALRALGREEQARTALEAAAGGLEQPGPALYYHDQPPEAVAWQGMALRALGAERAAAARFELLLARGREQLGRTPEIDYFAVSLPDFLVFEPELERRNELHCRFLMALGLAGLGRRREAETELARLRELDPAHLGGASLQLWLGETREMP